MPQWWVGELLRAGDGLAHLLHALEEAHDRYQL
jgi:hypothetical protein